MKIEQVQAKDKSIEFAPAHLEEAAALLRVIHAAYAEFLDKLDPPSGAFGETTASIQAKMAKGGAIKAMSEGTIVGCVLYEPRADYIYFGRLAVLPAWRRYGIAKGLIHMVETYSRATQFDRVQIGVRLVLPAHQAYYEALGYRPIEYTCHPGFAEPTSVTMTKQLA